MFDKMKELMEMKKQAERIKKELDQTTVEVAAVKGISIVVDGAQKFRSIAIDDALVREGGARQLETALLKGLNEAIKQSQDLATQKMRGMMPGLPGV